MLHGSGDTLTKPGVNMGADTPPQENHCMRHQYVQHKFTKTVKQLLQPPPYYLAGRVSSSVLAHF